MQYLQVRAQPRSGSIIAESARLAHLAWPLVLSNLGNIAIQVTDTVMIGRLGPTELAAVGLATHLSLVVSLLCTGAMEAVAPLVAQASGRDTNNRFEISSVVQHALVLGMVMCLPLCALLWDTTWVFRVTAQMDSVTEIGSLYLRTFLFAIPALVIATCLRGLVVGLEQSRLVLYVSIATVVVNFIGNWILIFGNLGAPELGVRGAALSSVIAAITSVLIFLVLIQVKPALKAIRLFSSRWQFRLTEFTKLLKLGVPIGLILLVEIAFFTATAILVGGFGIDQLAGHQIAVQTVALTLMVPLAIGQAATVRVALSVGRGDVAVTKLSSLVPLWATAIIMVGLGCALWFGAPQIATVYLGSGSVDDRLAVVNYAEIFLRVAAVFQIVDGLQAAAAGVLRGFRDTVTPLIIACLAYWVAGIPLAYLLSKGYSMGGFGVWVGIAVALGVCAVSMVVRVWWVRSVITNLRELEQ